VLTATWSPRGAHGYVIGVAIAVRCKLKVKLGMQKRLQGLDKRAQKAGPAAFFRSLEVPGLRYKCSCMIRLDIQLV